MIPVETGTGPYIWIPYYHTMKEAVCQCIENSREKYLDKIETADIIEDCNDEPETGLSI